MAFTKLSYLLFENLSKLPYMSFKVLQLNDINQNFAANPHICLRIGILIVGGRNA